MGIPSSSNKRKALILSRKAFLASASSIVMTACSSAAPQNQSQSQDASSLNSLVKNDEDLEFSELGDDKTLQYVADRVYSATEYALNSEDFKTESVQAVYVSKEYWGELSYNSKANVYFGYSLSELQDQFLGTTYVFTEIDGKTEVEAFEEPDTTFNDVAKNVAVGAGVILVCVTISIGAGAVATAAVGSASLAASASTVSTVFAASAKTAATFALSSSVLGGLAAGIASGFSTGDVNAAIKEAAVKGSESFKWGALGGAVVGGISTKIKLSNTVRTWQQSEEYASRLLGGVTQQAYLNGAKVAKTTPGSTRPDIVRWVDGKLEAVEVKNYDLESAASLDELKYVLKQEISDRTIHLPEGSTQRVVLDVGGRGYSGKFVDAIVDELTTLLQPIDGSIVVEAIS